MWSCQIGLCGVFVIGYELPLLWNNLLTPREEIKNENWSFVVHRNKMIECRCLHGFWWKNNTWSRLVRLYKTFATRTNFCMINNWDLYNVKSISTFLFGGDNNANILSKTLMGVANGNVLKMKFETLEPWQYWQ
jgi:hypothetical protein